MSKSLSLLVGLSALLGILLVVSAKQIKGGPAESSIEETEVTALPKLPSQQLSSQSSTIPVAPAPKEIKRVITLESGNTYVFRGVVTGQSVGRAIKEIGEMSARLNPSDHIYLVLDSPGGSVPDGADMIDFLNSLPQKVTTITIFAASMAFHIAESNPGERLIVPNGTLMSHRARVSGFEGQFDGEFESRYNMAKRQIDVLDLEAATRMGLTLEQYKSKIINELWVYGFDSKKEKVADEVVYIRCGRSMGGTMPPETFQTPFGSLEVEFANCPIIKFPVKISMAGIGLQYRPYVQSKIRELYFDQEAYVRKEILTEEYRKFFIK